jgi:hypothetical protein
MEACVDQGDPQFSSTFGEHSRRMKKGWIVRTNENWTPILAPPKFVIADRRP